MLRRLLPPGIVSLLALVSCSDAPTLPDAGDAPLHNLSAEPTIEVVMSGLNAPRGLAWGPGGALYVTEAGNTEVRGACVPVPRGESCYSGSGSISRLHNGQQERVFTELPSTYNPATMEILGVHDLEFHANGTASFTIGWGGPPEARAGLGPVGEQFGVLVHATSATSGSIVDIAGFEQLTNPDGGLLDSNPYGLLVEGSRRYVTDAGSNGLLEVRDGEVSLVAVFPSRPVPPPLNEIIPVAEAVPTEVQRGPDGALYVSILSGAPFPPGDAGIYRVVPGEEPELYAGFTAVLDFAFAPDGGVFVVEFASEPFLGGNGALVHVAPDLTRTVISDQLMNPTSVLVGRDGAVYVTNRGNEPGAGEVLRFSL